MVFEFSHVFARLPKANHYWLAISGGLDSVVLLHLFNRLAKAHSLPFTAVHIHHGLSMHADQWQVFCQELCVKWHISFRSEQVDAKACVGESREEVARRARYGALHALLSAQDCLITAHHQDDQAETFLLQLFRGAGVKGLAAMAELQALPLGQLYRPLLSFSRTQIMAYAQQHQLDWIEDESNQDTTFDRNFVRQQLLPQIKLRWPQASETIDRSAQLCGEADHLLQEFAALDWQRVQGTQPATLSVNKLLQLSDARQANVIRYWLQREGHLLPTQRKLMQLRLDMLHARTDANPVICWRGTEVRRYRDELYVMKASQGKVKEISSSIVWDLTDALSLSLPWGYLSACMIKGGGLYLSEALAKTLEIRFRVGGEICKPAGRGGHRTLKKLLQEWQIPTWQRDKIPLIYVAGQLACIPGYCIDEAFVAPAEQYGWQIKFILFAN